MDLTDIELERFWAKVDKTESCWVWTASKDTKGYGKLTLRQRTYRAHRVAYEYLVGPISDGLQLDHLCRNRRCVRPDHLEPVTSRENLLRGDTVNARLAAKTHCDSGHPFDEVNTYRAPDGTRHCRKCHVRWTQDYRRRKTA
jgi:hypothetical protein